PASARGGVCQLPVDRGEVVLAAAGFELPPAIACVAVQSGPPRGLGLRVVPAVLAAVGIDELGLAQRDEAWREGPRLASGRGLGYRCGGRRRLSRARPPAAERVMERDALRVQDAWVEGHLIERARAEERRLEARHELEDAIAEPLVARVRLSGITGRLG